MILSVAIILITCIILSVIMVKRVIVHPVIIKMLGIILIYFTVLVYAVKFSTYYSLNLFEQKFYIILNSMNLSAPQISFVMNIGTALLFASSVFYVVSMSKKKKVAYALLIPIAVFFVINHPFLCEKLYIYANKDYSFVSPEMLRIMLKQINILFIVVYSLLPYIMHVTKYFHTHLWYKRRNYLFSLLIVFMMDMLVYVGIMFGNIGNYFMLNLNLIKYPVSVATVENSVFSLAYTVVIFALTLFILIRIKPLGKIKSSAGDILAPDSTPQTVSMMLHGYKNAFVAIEMFSDDNNKSFLGSDDARFEKIRKIAIENEEKIKDVINIINSNRNISLMKNPVSLSEIIDNAIGSMKSDDSVKIEKNIHKDYVILADEYHFKEVLICLLNNAYESFHGKDGEKYICVNVGMDDGDIYLEIKDNGCGIKRKKEIFNPLYSSKNGVTNFGIGLTYAKNIIEAHEGIINISSKENKGTSVQIILKPNQKKITQEDVEELICQKSE